MDWEPNIDAMEYFCRDIWPGVKAAVPAARLRVVGRNPGWRVQNLASDSVEVTGRVASVVQHLKQAAVVVVPLRVGGGTRLKIYEAMAAGKAVVSTSVGAEGLDVHDGRDIILADSAGAFRDGVVALLQDRDLRRRYERAAAELAAGCGWPAVTGKFEAVLQQVAGMAARVAEELAPAARN
jgi:glycosyltransferase involved in cell wall biosynthesis